MSKQDIIVSHHKVQHGTVKSYSIGFLYSIGLTIVAYDLVVGHFFSKTTTIVAILILAVLQLFVQLFFFLHLGKEAKPRWNTLAFIFMMVILLIVVVGSLWIMANLNYHSMTPQEIIKDEGLNF